MSSKKKFQMQTTSYEDVKDVCDQRSPVNDPQELYNQFVLDEEVHEELENEHVSDFDNDVHDYEDIGEYGQEIVIAQNLDRDVTSKIKFRHKPKAAPAR